MYSNGDKAVTEIGYVNAGLNRCFGKCAQQRRRNAADECNFRCGARMSVLETQSCNENAIAFYRKNGFEIIGFDVYSCQNTDPERHEIRIEMGKIQK